MILRSGLAKLGENDNSIRSKKTSEEKFQDKETLLL